VRRSSPSRRASCLGLSSGFGADAGTGDEDAAAWQARVGASPPDDDDAAAAEPARGRPGGATVIQLWPAGSAARGGEVHAAARAGVATGGGRLPHLDVIQGAFGRHDVSGVAAHVGGAAADAARAIGAEAYAIDGHVAFAAEPSLFVAAGSHAARWARSTAARSTTPPTASR
jgi:hypothetical protein